MPNPGKEKLIQLYYQKKKRLQEIGDYYSVSRERVRQWMERYSLPRSKKGKYKHPTPKYESLDEYFKAVKNGKKENKYELLKFISPLKEQCAECSSTENLHIHHRKYPALCLKDIQILCCSCHWGKHGKGNGNRQQLKICNEYFNGLSGYQLAQKYNVTFGMIYHILHKWNIKIRPKGRLTKNSNKRDLTS